MKVQIIVGDQIVNSQLISVEALGRMPPVRDLKRMALKAALADHAISVSQSLQARFKLFDVMGQPIEDDEPPPHRY